MCLVAGKGQIRIKDCASKFQGFLTEDIFIASAINVCLFAFKSGHGTVLEASCFGPGQ